MIENTFDRFVEDGGIELEAVSHRVEAVSEGSAMVSIVWQRREVRWTNVYFFRVIEDGKQGWEGGVFDGEVSLIGIGMETMGRCANDCGRYGI